MFVVSSQLLLDDGATREKWAEEKRSQPDQQKSVSLSQSNAWVPSILIFRYELIGDTAVQHIVLYHIPGTYIYTKICSVHHPLQLDSIGLAAATTAEAWNIGTTVGTWWNCCTSGMHVQYEYRVSSNHQPQQLTERGWTEPPHKRSCRILRNI